MRLGLFLPFLAAPLALAVPEPNPIAPRAPESTGGLLSELPGILDGVQQLLSKETIDDLEVIVSGAAKLLKSDNIDVLQDILTNAHALLTKDFVDNTTTLIGDATPVGTPLYRRHVERSSMLTRFLAGGRCFEAAGRSAGYTIKRRVHELLVLVSFPYIYHDSIRIQRGINICNFVKKLLSRY